MRVLVTGGAGYIGSHVVRALNEAGHDTWVLDDLSTGDSRLTVHHKMKCGEVGNMSLEGLDAVVHCAGSCYVEESVSNPALYYQNNVGETASLLRTMVRDGVKNFVFSSSCTIHDPISPYAKSKAMIEKMLEDLEQARQIHYVSLRYYNAAGASRDGLIGECHRPETHIIPIALEAAYQNKTFTINGNCYPTPDGTCVRDYVHVEDLADAHVLAIEWFAHNWRSLYCDLGNGKGFSVLEVLDSVERISGRKVAIQLGPPRLGDSPYQIASNLTGPLPWKPKYVDLDLIVSTADRWYRKEKGL